jgi:hypothetical protein
LLQPCGRQAAARNFEISEAIVHAAADRIRLEADVVGHRPAGDAAVELAEIGIEIFGLRASVRHHRVFDAEAGGKAHLGFARIATLKAVNLNGPSFRGGPKGRARNPYSAAEMIKLGFARHDHCGVWIPGSRAPARAPE